MPKSRPVRLAENMVTSNRYVSVYMDDVRFPNGRDGTHVRIVEPTGGAVALVANVAGEIYLHRCYHYAADQEFLEIVRGYGEPGEGLEQTVLRELDEEAGFEFTVSEGPILLGRVAPNSTVLSHIVPVYAIRVDQRVTRSPKDNEESISDGAWYRADEVSDLVTNGDITDGFTLSALSFARARNWPARQSSATLKNHT